VVASVSESAPPATEIYERGVKVVTAGDVQRSLPGLKSGNYLASVRAKAHAESAGAFECLLTTGTPPVILEGSYCNVLLWDGAGLVTPPPEGRLPGVTLGVVLSAARDLGITLSETEVTVGAASRGGLLLIGSLLGVCPCSHLDDKPLADSSTVAAGLRGRLWEYESMSLAQWRTEWTATM
jgi:branched-subunit amino acid aminotransferase/4-amino-4-deoxychorismate lyase